MTDMLDPIEARRNEVAAYDRNIAIYRAILAGLPEEWPEDLAKYKNPSNTHSAVDNVPDDLVEQVAQLWYADELRHLIRTETVERTKAAAILAALEAGA
jgi:hypothetical protein